MAVDRCLLQPVLVQVPDMIAPDNLAHKDISAHGKLFHGRARAGVTGRYNRGVRRVEAVAVGTVNTMAGALPFDRTIMQIFYRVNRDRVVPDG